MTGWLPIELELDHCPFVTCPSITAAPTVRWMHFGDNSLSEPFFRQTVQRLRTGNRPALEIETTHYSVVREANRHSSLLPIGFICHISRCGSTLISNALKVLEGIQVVAEASPIYRLFLPSPRQVPRWPRSNEELRRIRREPVQLIRLLQDWCSGADRCQIYEPKFFVSIYNTKIVAGYSLPIYYS